MTNPKAGRVLLAIVTMTLILTLATTFTGPVSAVKKSSGGNVITIHKTGSKTTTPNHVKGVKVLHVHTVPSKVAVGGTFALHGIVFNNSTATITFANGTCASAFSVTFNKNVMSEPQATTAASCKTQQVTLKPGAQSPILIPNLSGIAYRATAPGMTNTTMTFKYGALTTTSKSPVSDSISRVYSFNILPAGSQSVSLEKGLHSTPSPQSGPPSSSSNTILAQGAKERIITPQTNRSASTTNSTPNQFVTYQNPVIGIRIQHPADWRTVKGSLNQVGFISPLENKLDRYTEGVYVHIVRTNSSNTLGHYIPTEIKYLQNTLPDFHLITSSATNLAGLPADQIVYSHTYTGAFLYDLTSFKIITIKGNAIYIVTFSAESAKYTHYIPIVRNMIGSFQILG